MLLLRPSEDSKLLRGASFIDDGESKE